jgi:hypothetical protein
VGVGTSALRNNKKSNDNIGVGLNAGYYITGTGINGGNIYMGSYAGQGVAGNGTGIYKCGHWIS